MTYYRLLRNNKESGPFAEDEIIAKGFKPYDLIWVEGKSAGWRYPSEIPVFKNYAPVVEEQPYDRFYKKQPAQKLFATEEKNSHAAYVPVVAKANETMQPQQSQAAQPTKDYTVQPLPGRHIHVTLPSGNTVNLTTLVAKKENKESREINETNKPAYIETRQPAYSEPVYNAAPPVTKEINKKIITASLENADNNIEPVYVNRPRAYQFAGFSWSLIAAAFIGIATLVGLGIMIGLSMNREKNDLAFNEAIRNKSKQPVLVRENNNTKPLSANTTPDLPATATNEALQPSSSPAGKNLVQNAVVKTAISPDNNNDTKEAKRLPGENTVTEKSNLPANQNEIQHPKPIAPVINVEKNLSLTASDFKTGAFGGISGLKYTLVNDSKFPLESVEVEVDYIQANNKIFKTEKLLFKDISAGAQATIEAPSSSRGVKINSRIIKVNAKETTLSNTTAKS